MHSNSWIRELSFTSWSDQGMLEKFLGVALQWSPSTDKGGRVFWTLGWTGRDLPLLRFYPVTKLEAEGLGDKIERNEEINVEKDRGRCRG